MESIAVIGVCSIGIFIESHCELVAAVPLRVRELSLDSKREIVAEVVVEQRGSLVCTSLDDVVQIIGHQLASLHITILHRAVDREIRVATHTEAI